MTDFKTVIGEAIGEASMCWSETPSGVFDSSRASLLVDRILEAHHAAFAAFVEIFADHDALAEKLKTATEALLCAEEFIDSVVEDLESYAENRSCPNEDEFSSAKMVQKQIKLALTRLK